MKNLILLALMLLFPLLVACRKQPAKVALEPPSTPPQVIISPTVLPPANPLPPAKWPAPAPPPSLDAPPRPAPAVYLTAEVDFENARYVLAARGYERYLRDYPSRGNEDRVLFHLGISYALADSSLAGMRKAKSRLERLLMLYPDSPYRPQARVILDLQSQIEQRILELQSNEDRIRQLTEELNKLKKIDMERQQPSKSPP